MIGIAISMGKGNSKVNFVYGLADVFCFLHVWAIYLSKLV